jgi:acylphosphatase
MGVTAIHLIIHGRVQGVGYRSWAVQTARSLGLNGWVRNRNDGTVEAVISGDHSAVKEMRAACQRGPIAAKVATFTESAWEVDVAEGFEQLETL